MATELDQRVAEETANIKVDSYQKVASLGGWSGGGRTLWAIALVGAVAGAAIGLVAPFFPLIVGASTLATAIGAVPASLAAFTATGLSMGFGGGLVLGRVSGAAAAVAEENERRMKEWTARQILQQNPEAHIVPDAPKEEPAPKKPLGKRIADTYRTYMNPKVGLTMIGIGLLGGLIIGAGIVTTGGAVNVLMPAIGTLTGLGAEMSNAAIMAYATGVAGAFGALFSFNFPKLTSETTHFFGELLSGKYYHRGWEPKPEKQKETPRAMSKDEAVAEEIIAESKYTRNVKPAAGTFQELLAKQAEQAGEMLMKR